MVAAPAPMAGVRLDGRLGPVEGPSLCECRFREHLGRDELALRERNPVHRLRLSFAFYVEMDLR